jgi:6-phosphogluconolactonase
VSGPDEVEIMPDAASVAARAAAYVAGVARLTVAERGRFTFAVSGGHTPWAMFAALAEHELPWDKTSIFQVDERVAPAGDPDRNLTHLRASLPAGADAEIDAMPVEDEDLEAAAERYGQLLPQPLDLVHLGLGPDGHTASLVPGDPVLDVDDRDVALTGTYQGRRRMTLTYRALNGARERLWLVTGEDKHEAVRRLRAGDTAIPAGRVTGASSLLIGDVAAAGQA